MTSLSHRTLPVVALGATLLFAGACNTAGTDAGTPGPTSAAAAADNTAEICKSSGEATRTAVLGLFGKLGALAEGDEASAEAEYTKIYQATFGTMRDDLRAASARATDPEFAAVLSTIAGEADKIATATDPAAIEMTAFQATLEKLETYCPRGGKPGASVAPGGVVNGTVGAKGSACVLPVTFAVPAKWKPQPVDTGDDDPLAELTRKGPLRMACEIKAQPAGITGFLRVYVDPKNTGDADAALRALQDGDQIRNATATPFQADGRPAVELRYQLFSKLLEEYSDRRAFAVPTPGGVVVVELAGLDSDDPAMLAGYENARNTLTFNS